jgi:hypothetical protein
VNCSAAITAKLLADRDPHFDVSTFRRNPPPLRTRRRRVV